MILSMKQESSKELKQDIPSQLAHEVAVRRDRQYRTSSEINLEINELFKSQPQSTVELRPPFTISASSDAPKRRRAWKISYTVSAFLP